MGNEKLGVSAAPQADMASQAPLATRLARGVRKREVGKGDSGEKKRRRAAEGLRKI